MAHSIVNQIDKDETQHNNQAVVLEQLSVYRKVFQILQDCDEIFLGIKNLLSILIQFLYF